MGAFDWMFAPSADPAVSTGPSTGTSTAGVPQWYEDYTKGIAGKAMELGGAAANNPVPQQSVAGFTPDQAQAFQGVRDMQGAWAPGMTTAGALTQGAVGAAGGATAAANAAVAGQPADFTQKYQQYMSPYTQQVVSEIGRLGKQNFEENLMPGVNAAAIGAGQFGSTRNAELLGRAARDSASATTGQQAAAMESGYAQAGTLFNADANRDQQQQQMQASTALSGGQLMAGTGLSAGQQTGALTQAGQALRLGDAQALQASGQQQQQLNQAGLDTAYNNTVAANNNGWTNLNNMSSIVRGVQLPVSQTSTNSGALTRTYGASPLSQLGTTYAAVAGS